MNIPLTPHDIIIILLIIHIAIWTLINLAAKIIIFTIVMALIIILCLMAFNKPLPNQHKSPIKQKKSRPVLYTFLTSLIPFPATFIITYFFIYNSESENSNTAQNFLNQSFRNYGLMEILAMLAPTFLYILLVLALTSTESQNSNKKEVQIKKSKASLQKSRKKSDKKAGKKAKANKDRLLLSTFSKHSKILISSSTILAIIAYISVLKFNLESASGDTGTALQITSIQFSENNFKWIAQLSMYTLLAYLTLLPALLIPELRKHIRPHHSIPILKNLDPKNPIHLCITLILISTALTTIINICITGLFLSALKDNIGFFLISTPMLSYLLCTLSIILTLNRKFQITSSQENSLKSGLPEALLWLLASILTLFVAYIFIMYIPYNLGRAIANPGKALGSSESTYDCIFPVDPKSRDSIAFGVIAASKPESVHIFTPEYNQESNSYGKEIGNGKVIPNKLVESQVKIPGGYRIEKFDDSKHGYNLHTGKCEYVQTRYSLKDIFYEEYIENSKKPPRK